jgi:hypothetical protein
MAKKQIHDVRLLRHRIAPVTEPDGSLRRHKWSLAIGYSDSTEEATWWNNSELALAYLIAQHEATGRAGGF